ncbi:MAG: hypothetical protein J6K01_03280 [Paludibacteraceae bacterium]|nr:hypothetical protein [Paludibacteraceae bacterium]
MSNRARIALKIEGGGQKVKSYRAQSQKSWIEAAKAASDVQFRSSVVNDLNFESINLPYFKDSVAFTTENGAQIAGAQRVKCYQFTVDKDTAIYVAAYNVNEIWGATFKISDEPFQSNYTPDDVISSPNPVKINISAGTHYVAFGDNNYYRTNFFASWLSISFKDEPVTAAAPVIRNSLYKEISLPYRNDSLAFTAENGAVKTQTGPSSFSNVLRYRITVPKDTSLYFQGYNSKYDHGISMIIRQSDINSGPYISIPTTLTSEGKEVDLPAGTSYISLSDDEFSGDEFFVTAFSIRAKGDTLKDVKSPVVYPVTPNGAITFKEISLPFSDSIFFNKANGAVYNGNEKLLGFKVTVPQDTAIKYTGSSKYGWGPVLYTSNTEFDASLDGLKDYWPGDKINLKAGVNYIAFGDDGFDGDAFYRAKVSIKLTNPTPIAPITFKEISLPYRNDNLAFTEENGAVDNGNEKLLGFKITVAKDTTLYFQGYNDEYHWGPNFYYSKSEFDINLNGTSYYFLGSSSGSKISLTAGTWYIALGDDGFDNDDYYVTAFAISAENESQSLVSPTLPEKPAVSLTFKEISLPYVNENLAFTEENGAVDSGNEKLLGFKITVAKDTTLNFQGYNDKYDWSTRIYYSKSEFNNKLNGTSSAWLGSSSGNKISLTAGTWYIALGDDGFDEAEYYVTAFAISAENESQSLVSPTAPEKPATPLTFKEISLPYSGDMEFSEESGSVEGPYGFVYNCYKFTVASKGTYKFVGDNSSMIPFVLSDTEFDSNFGGGMIPPFSGQQVTELKPGTYYMAIGNGDGEEMQFSISLTDDIKEVTLPYYHDGTEFTEKVSGLAPYDMYYDIYTFTLTEDKDVYIYGGNVPAGNEFVVAISDRYFSLEEAYIGAPWVTTYTDNSEPKKVSLTAGKYYVMISDDGFAYKNGFSKYVAAVSFSYTDSVAQDKSSFYEPIPYTEITLPYTGTLEFTKENTVKGVSWGYPAQLLGLKFTVDKDTTIYLQSKDTEHYGVSAYIDSCMITTDSIMAAPSHLKNLGYEFIDEKKAVDLKAGTYYIVLSDDGFGEHNSDYSYYSTVFSITFDENPDYLSVEEISKVGVEEGEADAVKAYGRRGSIIVSGAGDDAVKVFGANGAPIYSSNGDAVIPALPGIYAVRVADKAFKVVVR